jgi:hypothetical protein
MIAIVPLEILLPNWMLALALCCGRVYFHEFENFKYNFDKSRYVLNFQKILR